jgi:hypothetical protein
LQPPGNNIGMAQNAAAYPEAAIETIDRRLPVSASLPRKILFEHGIFGKEKLGNAARTTLIIVFLLENLCTVYPG